MLTKRPERMMREVHYWRKAKDLDMLPDNIWVGVSVENQRRADERIPALLDTRATTRFLSVEPMLGPVDLGPLAHIDWVICGAESGPRRRPFDVRWAVDLYEQCRDAGVPFFFKQGSHLYPGRNDELPGYGAVKQWPEIAARPCMDVV